MLGNGKYWDNWDEGDGSGTSRGESKDACRLEYEDERDVRCGRFGGCGCSIGSKQKRVSVSLSGCKLFWDADGAVTTAANRKWGKQCKTERVSCLDGRCDSAPNAENGRPSNSGNCATVVHSSVQMPHREGAHDPTEGATTLGY